MLELTEEFKRELVRNGWQPPYGQDGSAYDRADRRTGIDQGIAEMTPHEIELRDRFAEGALHALISSPSTPTRMKAEEAVNVLATAAYLIADAMLEARKRKP